MQSSPAKIHYLDNLRIFLTTLVIVHHLLVTYGGAGSWYYNEKSTEMLPLIIMTMIVATNQAFFMGFFFFLSALFTEPSYDRKGSVAFMKDRLIRLGIPLLFYSFIFGPCLNFIVARYGHGYDYSFLEYLSGYDDWIDFGVLWFVAALLFFTCIFDVVKRVSPRQAGGATPVPSNSSVIIFAIMLGIVCFAVRTFFPVGKVLTPLGWQLGHFPQYIALFYIGVKASRNDWLGQLSWTQGKKLVILPVLMIVVGFPLIYAVKTITHSDIATFSGGLHWQALMYGVWEQVTGLSIIVVLLSYGKEAWNATSTFRQTLSRSAFAAYIFHPLFVIGISLLLKPVQIDPAWKLVVAIPIAIVATFLFARLVLLIPGVKRII